MSLAKGLTKSYEVNSPLVLQNLPETEILLGKPTISLQPIATATSLRRGTRWQDPVMWKGIVAVGMDQSIHGFRDWKLKSIINNDEEKILTFEIGEEWMLKDVIAGLKPYDAEAPYRKIIEEINEKIDDNKLKIFIRDMLVKLFPLRILKEIIASGEQPEFIIDDIWMYLKIGKKAYRT